MHLWCAESSCVLVKDKNVMLPFSALFDHELTFIKSTAILTTSPYDYEIHPYYCYLVFLFYAAIASCGGELHRDGGAQRESITG